MWGVAYGACRELVIGWAGASDPNKDKQTSPAAMTRHECLSPLRSAYHHLEPNCLGLRTSSCWLNIGSRLSMAFDDASRWLLLYAYIDS